MSVVNLYRSSWLLAIAALLLASAVAKPGPTKQQLKNRSRTIQVGIILFPGFEPLDVMGPLEIFYQMSVYYPMKLAMIAEKVGPVTTLIPPHVMVPGQPPVDLSYMIAPQYMATHTNRNAPKLDILLVPGGMGNMALIEQNNTWIEEFIQDRIPELDYLLSVCTGAASLARAGVLKRKRATTNKGAWAWVTSFGEKIKWVPSARWTSDGKIWTSSGVAAGIDMGYAFLKMFYGEDDLNPLMNSIEYAPHTDPNWDPFAVVHNVPGADTSRPLVSCVGPVGY